MTPNLRIKAKKSRRFGLVYGWVRANKFGQGDGFKTSAPALDKHLPYGGNVYAL